jgi:hypothetical protein
MLRREKSIRINKVVIVIKAKAKIYPYLHNKYNEDPTYTVVLH